MSVCVATIPSVQLQGVDLFFWVFGQVAVFAAVASVVMFFAFRWFMKNFPEGT